MPVAIAGSFITQQCPNCLEVLGDPRAIQSKSVDDYVKVCALPFETKCVRCGWEGTGCFSLEWHVRRIMQTAESGGQHG